MVESVRILAGFNQLRYERCWIFKSPTEKIRNKLDDLSINYIGFEFKGYFKSNLYHKPAKSWLKNKPVLAQFLLAANFDVTLQIFDARR